MEAVPHPNRSLQVAALMPFCCLLWCSGTWASLQHNDQPKHFGSSENPTIEELCFTVQHPWHLCSQIMWLATCT